MSLPTADTALLKFLRGRSDVYSGKVLELRESVEGWLAYVPQTFPHYTRHTVRHSDQIIANISKLLFIEDDPLRPIVQLSPAEAYLLAAAAYLHDAGMVTSDREKAEILGTDAWREWVSGDSGGAKRWAETLEFRSGTHPPDEGTRHFLADVQTRFLIAEFVRRVHHLRAADVVAQHQEALGRFAFDDPVLQRTIADVCVAHGLKPHELDDREKYPEHRDVRNDPVNVKFVAIILRLGDLLDMSIDRACPLLLNAACPLSAESYAHWSQYQRITHRSTTPERIEITAECQTQDEHRFLQDWCQWIVDEVAHARVVMARTARHGTWQPPKVGLEAPDQTINIRPATKAIYIPSKWIFELDRDAIFERLIHDVYTDPLSFVQELIQNALDAMRCQMYQDLSEQGLEPPQYPTLVDASIRQRYRLHVALEPHDLKNELSGEIENRQLLIVEDCGIGMDREVIERYFLQVGRSYYTTEEFRRSFRFAPTSQFGVGFLSVFAASDKVVVDTYKPSTAGSPIRCVLTGPRGYLLTERGRRSTPGTRVEVLLRERLPPRALTRAIVAWCRRVEFPISVNDEGSSTIVVAETAEQFVYDLPDITGKGARFVMRTFPVSRPGIEGELYVFGRTDRRGESWAAWDYSQYTYPKSHPQAVPPPRVDSIKCFHGIGLESGSLLPNMSARLDFRGPKHRPTLSRSRLRPRWHESHETEIVERWEEIVKEHLSTSRRALGVDSWRYKQSLVDLFDLPSLWAAEPGTVRVFSEGRAQLLSLIELEQAQRITAVGRIEGRLYKAAKASPGSRMRTVGRFEDDESVITFDDIAAGIAYITFLS